MLATWSLDDESGVQKRAQSVWTASGLPALWEGRESKAGASSAHSKRFARFEIVENCRAQWSARVIPIQTGGTPVLPGTIAEPTVPRLNSSHSGDISRSCVTAAENFSMA